MGGGGGVEYEVESCHNLEKRTSYEKREGRHKKELCGIE